MVTQNVKLGIELDITNLQQVRRQIQGLQGPMAGGPTAGGGMPAPGTAPGTAPGGMPGWYRGPPITQPVLPGMFHGPGLPQPHSTMHGASGWTQGGRPIAGFGRPVDPFYAPPFRLGPGPSSFENMHLIPGTIWSTEAGGGRTRMPWDPPEGQGRPSGPLGRDPGGPRQMGPGRYQAQGVWGRPEQFRFADWEGMQNPWQHPRPSHMGAGVVGEGPTVPPTPGQRFRSGFGSVFESRTFGTAVGSGLIENFLEQGLQALIQGLISAIESVVSAINQWRKDIKQAAEKLYRLPLAERHLDRQTERTMAALGGENARLDIDRDRATTTQLHRIQQRAGAGDRPLGGLGRAIDQFDVWRIQNRDNVFSDFFLGQPGRETGFQRNIGRYAPGAGGGFEQNMQIGNKVIELLNKIKMNTEEEARKPTASALGVGGGFLNVGFGFAGLAEKLADAFASMYDWFKEQFAGIGDWFKNLFGNVEMPDFSGIAEWFKDLPELITNLDWFKDMIQKAIDWWNKLVDLIKKPWNWFKDKIIDPIVSAFKWVWDKIKAGWNAVKDFIANTVWPALRDKIFKPIWEAAKWAWDKIKAGFNALKKFITETAWPAMRDHVFKPIWEAAKWAWDKIKVGFEEVKNWITTTVWPALSGSVIAPVIKFFQASWKSIKDLFMYFKEEILTSVWSKIRGSVVAPLVNFFKSTWKSIYDLFMWFREKILTTVWDKIRGGVVAPLINFFKNAWKSIYDLFMYFKGQIENSPWNPLNLRGMTSSWGNAINQMQRMWNSFIRRLAVPTLPSIPRVTPFAEGGIVMPKQGGTLGLLAEAGEPEAVIPLSKMNGMGGNTITITINTGDVYDVGDFEGRVESTVRRAVRSGTMSNDLHTALVGDYT